MGSPRAFEVRRAALRRAKRLRGECWHVKAPFGSIILGAYVYPVLSETVGMSKSALACPYTPLSCSELRARPSVRRIAGALGVRREPGVLRMRWL